MCNCTGEVTYSPELFDGYVYTVPAVEQAYKARECDAGPCVCLNPPVGKMAIISYVYIDMYRYIFISIHIDMYFIYIYTCIHVYVYTYIM